MSLSSIAVAYYLLLSLFPMLLIVGNILPYFNLNTGVITRFLNAHLPEQLASSMDAIVHSVLSQPNTGLLSISVVFALWTFSRAISALQMAFNKGYEVSEHRDFVMARVFGIIAGLVLLLFLYVAVGLATFGEMGLERLQSVVHMNEALYHTLHNMTVPAVAIATFLVLGVLYFILPNVQIGKIRHVLPGTIFSTFVLVFLTNIIAKIISRALANLQDFKVVGTLAVFVLMLWFIFLARVLILGAIFNAVYQRHQTGEIKPRRGDIVQLLADRRKKEG
jgi:membrane protein